MIYDLTLDRIHPLLVINGDNTEDKSLFYGGAGISIYFYYRSRQLNDNDLKAIAEEQFEQVSQLNNPKTFDYFRGYSGIGYCVEFLNSNGFINIDTNDFLENIDSKIFYQIAVIDTSDLKRLWSLGKYLKARFYSSNESQKLIISEFLVHLTDKIYQYYTLQLSDYKFNIDDIRTISFMMWCLQTKINTNKLMAFQKYLEDIFLVFGENVLCPAVWLNLSYLIKNQLPKVEFDKLEFSKIYFEFRDQLVLLLNCASFDQKLNVKSIALKKLNAFLTVLNNEDKFQIGGLYKSNIVNYGLNGFAGMGIICISAKDEFEDMSWIGLFL